MMRILPAVMATLLGASGLAGLKAWRMSPGLPACSLTGGAGARERPRAIPLAPPARPRPDGRSLALRSIADIPLPGRPVRFDYQTGDTASGRLYISHMSDAHIEVFNTRTRTIVGRVSNTPGVTGVWEVPALHKLYASVTGHHQVAIIDADSLRVRANAGPIGFPDGIAYAPGTRRIFVSDESGGGELAIDGIGDGVVARIPLGGEAGNTKYDSGSGCIIVAVQTRNQLVTIDPASLKVVGRYTPAGADHPHGMLVDVPDRLLFVANQGNATLETIDLQSLRVTDVTRVGDDPDVLAYDPGRHELYVGTEDGGLWIYRIHGKQALPVGRLDLPHAHTVWVDPSTHLVYLPLQRLDGKPVLRILAGAP